MGDGRWSLSAVDVAKGHLDVESQTRQRTSSHLKVGRMGGGLRQAAAFQSQVGDGRAKQG